MKRQILSGLKTDLISVHCCLFSEDFSLRIKPREVSFYTVFLLLTIVLILSPLFPVQGVTAEWSPAIIVKTYSWYASKSELRNLKTMEQYRDRYLIGGKNVPGGGNEVSLMSAPPANFSFFNGSRLDLDVTVEGDIGIGPLQFGSDFHLCLLPLRTNNSNFFEVLFTERKLLENLTHSSYLNSSITNNMATVFLKYHDILDVQYQWDTTTGILVRKEVTAPSGLQLVVVQGRGISMPAWSSPLVLFAVLALVVWYNRHQNGKS